MINLIPVQISELIDILRNMVFYIINLSFLYMLDRCTRKLSEKRKCIHIRMSEVTPVYM